MYVTIQPDCKHAHAHTYLNAYMFSEEATAAYQRLVEILGEPKAEDINCEEEEEAKDWIHKINDVWLHAHMSGHQVYDVCAGAENRIVCLF
jgi:hypothetical protein